MVEIAELFAKDIPFLRVDFYIINGQIYLGEFTFFHNGGMSKFNPPEWNNIMGEWLVLPESKGQ